MFGLLAVLAGGVLWQLPTLLNWSLTQFLQQQGLTDIAVHTDDVGVAQSSITHLSFSYQQPDTAVRVKLDGLVVSYTLEQLLLGDVDHLSIESADIKLDHRANPQASTALRVPEIDLLLGVYELADPTSLPVKTLELPHIAILHNLASESGTSFAKVNLQAQIEKQKDQLQAKLVTSEQQALDIVFSHHSGWRMRYFAAPTAAANTPISVLREPSLSVALNRVDRSLVLQTELNAEFAERWLPPQTNGTAPGSNPTDTEIDFAKLTFTGTLKGREDSAGLELSSAVLIDDINVQDYRAKSASLQLDAQIVQNAGQGSSAANALNLNLKSRSTAALQNLTGAGWYVESLALSGASELTLADAEQRFASSDLSIAVDRLQNENGLELLSSAFTGAVSASLGAEQWQINISPLSKFNSKVASFDNTVLAQGFGLQTIKPVQISGVFADPAVDGLPSSAALLPAAGRANNTATLQLESTALEISVPEVKDVSLPDPVQIGKATLQLTQAMVSAGKFAVKGAINVPQLTLGNATAGGAKGKGKGKGKGMGNNLYQLNNFKQSFELENNMLTSRGSVANLKRDLTATTVAKHNFKTQRGDAELKFKSVVFDGPKRWQQLLSPMNLPLDVVVGGIDFSAQARWAETKNQWRTTVDVDAQLNNFGGAYNEIFFSGINGQLSLQVYPQLASKRPHTITANGVDMGVAAKNTTLEFTLQASPRGKLPSLNITQAQTQLLQGSLGLQPAIYDLNLPQQQIMVELENIDLSEIVRLQQLEGVQATGRVTGKLPLLIKEGKVSIDDGELHAVAPGGTLKYQTHENALKANKYAETVMLALENFNYDVLRANTQYEPDGTLLLNLRLQGKNPDFEAGRPVNLNINLEQNVLKLFESLRLIEGVSDRLDKRVQDFYQQSTSPQ